MGVRSDRRVRQYQLVRNRHDRESGRGKCGRSVKLVLGALAVMLVGTACGFMLRPFAAAAFLGGETSDRDSQVITAISKSEEVVLMSLGIQGIAERETNSELWGVDVPWSDRATFMQYGFTAKLGIDGADVAITQTGADTYLISIPEFVFVGHEEETFEVVVEDNGALSWVTPEVDTADMITKILNSDAEAQYIEANEWVLRDQATTFYEGIVAGIDPDLTVEFEFRD